MRPRVSYSWASVPFVVPTSVSLTLRSHHSWRAPGRAGGRAAMTGFLRMCTAWRQAWCTACVFGGRLDALVGALH